MVDLKNGITFIQTIFLENFKPDGIYVDGTCGNGFDTLFLGEQLEGKGHVFAFDIQPLALELTEKRLLDELPTGVQNISFVLDSHEHIDAYIEGPIDGILYNLGYLPAGDKNIITKSKSTLMSIKKALKLLKVGGLMGIMVYSGHKGGAEEEKAISDYFASLSQKVYQITKLTYLNRPSDSPYPIIVERIKED